MFVYFFIIIFTFFSAFLLSNGLKYVDPGFQGLEYSYATSILTPDLSKNIHGCPFNAQYQCFMTAIELTACQNDILGGFDAAGNKFVYESKSNYSENIYPFIFECLAEKFRAIEKTKKRFLWILDELNNAKNNNEELNTSLYPKCFEILKDCGLCQPSFPFHVMDEMIINCSDEAFKNANISSFSKKPLPSIPIELEALSMQKIGSIANSKAAENLTFNDLENMKFVASKNLKLGEFLCLSHFTELSMDIIKSYNNWFTLEEYQAVKNLLKENQYFRWFICSGIYAISSTSDLVCFPSKYKNCENLEKLAPETDIYANLQQCRKLVKSDDLHRGAICN